jgi:putative Mg2+ transporter-C (MgtC) family protein|tara:strand:+ start:761 stop:1138 length:378 start_codon:yes stop_codon:yes gene_type:complete
MSLRILLAAALGAIVGYERRRADKPVGLRTLILISTGAALFTVASVYAFGDGDPTRVAAGVVAGIGFLGAGVILRRRTGGIEGITTASVIWVVAAIGLAVGAGLYLIATVTTVVVMLVLLLLRHD